MKILVLSQWYPPEPVKLLSDLAESLVAAGHEVTVLTGFPNWPTGRTYPGYRQRICSRAVVNGVRVIRIPLYPDHSRSPFKRALNFVSFAVSAALLGPFVVSRPDAIHVVHPPITVALPAWFLSRLWRVPFTMEINDMWPENLRATGMLRSRGALQAIGTFARWVYARAARIRVVSPGFRLNLLAKGVPDSKIAVILNWVDMTYYRPLPPDPELSERLGMAGRFNVLYAGTIGLAQGLDTLVDAAEILRSHPDIQFVVAGDGVERERLCNKARLRTLNNISFLGQLPGSFMSSLYACADVLFLQLRDDPLFEITIPHKLFTYMAAAKPVLASIRGDTADLVVASGCGLVCAPSDPAALAESVVRLHRMSHEKRNEMGGNARRAASERFSRQKLAADVLKMIDASVRSA